MGVAAGRLRHRISINRITKGDAADTVEHVGYAWAEVKPITAAERFRAGETESDVTHTVTMRAEIAVTARDRIDYSGRTLEIVSVRNLDEADRVLELDAVEVT